MVRVGEYLHRRKSNTGTNIKAAERWELCKLSPSGQELSHSLLLSTQLSPLKQVAEPPGPPQSPLPLRRATGRLRPTSCFLGPL